MKNESTYRKYSPFRLRAALGLATPLVVGCAGGSSPSRLQTNSQQPASQTLSITTAALPAGSFGQFYKAQLQASGGVPPYRWVVFFGFDPLQSGLWLDPDTGLLSGVLTGGLQFTALVSDSANHNASRDLTLTLSPTPVKILTTILPPATVGAAYTAPIATNLFMVQFALVTPPSSLPPGIVLGQGALEGGATTAGTYHFRISATQAGNTDQRDFTLLVRDKQPRNDSIGSATPFSNGSWQASISPFADPVDSENPDTDYYALSAPGGSFVSVKVLPQSSIALVPVAEIIDASGQRFHSCNQPGTSADFTSPCVGDLIIGDQIDPDFQVMLGAMLTFKVPGTGSQKFFVHVLDWRGDARPDMLYQMAIFGA